MVSEEQYRRTGETGEVPPDGRRGRRADDDRTAAAATGTPPTTGADDRAGDDRAGRRRDDRADAAGAAPPTGTAERGGRCVRAVVVGAGIGGLAAAGALARSGWQVTLLERADRLRAGRPPLVLWPNGVRALAPLGLGAGLDGDRHARCPTAASAARTAAGWSSPRPTPADRMPVVVHREDLHDALIAGLGDRVEIRTGVTVPHGPRRPRRAPGGRRRPAHLRGRPGRRRRRHRQRDPPPARPGVGGGQLRLRRLAGGDPLVPGAPAARRPAGRRRDARRRLPLRGRARWASAARPAAPAGAASTGWPPPPARPGPSRRRPSSPCCGAGSPAGTRRSASCSPPPSPDDLVQQEVRELRPLPRGVRLPGRPGRLGAARRRRARHAAPPRARAPAWPSRTRPRCASLLRGEPGAGCAPPWRRTTGCAGPGRRRVVRQTRRMSAVLQARGRLALRARDAALGTHAARGCCDQRAAA